MTKNEIQQVGGDLITKAIEAGSSPENLQKLLDMQLQWQANEARKMFKADFMEFQSEKPKLVKQREVRFKGNLQYKYISLSEIQELIDPVLSRHGLSYRWEQNETEDGRITITCIVSHVSGHEERTSLTAAKDGSGSKNTVQSIGSTVSYLKRYTLEGALGLSSDIDTDGNKQEMKQDLSPEHPKWAGAKKAIKDGKTSLEAIKEVYNLTPENEEKLTA